MPKDLELAGAQETFLATVSYDTLDLYGKVEIAYPILVKAD